MSDILKDRIESEARAGMPINNKDLICKDCPFKRDDKTGICDVYPEFPDVKPNEVIKGGECEYYEKEE